MKKQGCFYHQLTFTLIFFKLPQFILRRLASLYSPRRYRIKYLTISFVVALILQFSLVACIQKPTSPLRVGYIVWPGYESLYLARDLDYYKDTSIRLVDYPSTSETIRAFRNGDLEAATLPIYETLQVAETEPSARIVLIMDSSYGADVILGKPKVDNLTALKGKRVGLESSSAGAYLLARAFEQVQLETKDVNIVSLGASEHEQAFKRGEIDAIVTFEPTTSKLMKVGANLLFDSKQIPGEILDLLVVREEIINEHPEAVKALIEGHFRALNYLKQNPLDAATRIARREGVTPQEFLKFLESIHIPTLQDNQKLLDNTNATSINQIHKTAQFMLDQKLLIKVVDIKTLLEDSIVKKISL